MGQRDKKTSLRIEKEAKTTRQFSASWVFLSLMALAFGMAAIPLRADSLKDYTATITPASFDQDDSHFAGPFTLTITNVDSDPGTNQIGSARIVVPEGFTAPSLGTLTVSSGKCWSASLSSGVIDLEAINCPGSGRGTGEGQQKLAFNESVSIEVSAVYCPGDYTWTTDASSEANLTWTFGDGDWTSESDPILSVTGHCSGGLANMPVNKTIDGVHAVCDDPGTPNTDESGSIPGGTGTGGHTPEFERPCTYAKPGNPNDLVLTLNDFALTGEPDDLRFGIHPYDTSTAESLAIPGAYFPQSGFPIPPQSDNDIPQGQLLTMCESPASGFSLAGVTVTATPTDVAGSDKHPAIYFVPVSGNADPSLDGTYACFNTQVPDDADEFALDLDNSNICTYTQGGWGSTPHGNNPGWLLESNFNSVYLGGSVTIGGTQSLTFESAAAIKDYLPMGGTPSALTSSAVNPTDRSNGGGSFAGQVLALQLNVDFSAADKFGAAHFGDFTVSDPSCYGGGSPTVSEVLEDANLLLGGDAATNGAACSITGGMNALVTKLNQSFDNCTAGPDSIIVTPPEVTD